MVVVYACHSGQDAQFVKTIATFFGVRAVGFSVDIGYKPPDQTNPMTFLRAGMRIMLGVGGTAVTATQ